MKALRFVFPKLVEDLRKMVRREIRRDVQQRAVGQEAVRQSLDLYEMKLETLDTRFAKRIMAMEARLAELEPSGQPRRRIPVPQSAA